MMNIHMAAEANSLTLDEQFFYRIALKNELLSPADGEECLRLRAALSKRGKSKPLQEIMLDTGLLTPEEVDEIHEAQSASQVVRLDSLYGDIAVRLGYAARPALEAAFAEQRRRRYAVRVGEILVDQGVMSSAQHRQILMDLLRSMKSEEKAYIQSLRLKKRAGGPPPPPESGEAPLSEAERIKSAMTEVGWRAPAPAPARPPPPAPAPTPAPTPVPVPARAPLTAQARPTSGAFAATTGLRGTSGAMPALAPGAPIPPPPVRKAPPAGTPPPATSTPRTPAEWAQAPTRPLPQAPIRPAPAPPQAAPPTPLRGQPAVAAPRPVAPAPAPTPAPEPVVIRTTPRKPPHAPAPAPPHVAAAPPPARPAPSAAASSDAIDLGMFDSATDAISDDDQPSAATTVTVAPAPPKRLVDSASSEDFLADSEDEEQRIAIAPLAAQGAREEARAKASPAKAPTPGKDAAGPSAGRASMQEWLGLDTVAGESSSQVMPGRPPQRRPSSDDELPESFFASNVLAVEEEGRRSELSDDGASAETEPRLPKAPPKEAPAPPPRAAAPSRRTDPARPAPPPAPEPAERPRSKKDSGRHKALGDKEKRPAKKKRPDKAALLASAIATFDEQPDRPASATANIRLAQLDASQVESDLTEVEAMIQAGAPSFSALKGRRVSGERGPAFSTDEYLRRRRRRAAVVRALVLGALLFVILPFGAGVYVAHGNRALAQEARAALERGDFDGAEAAAAQAGPFWIGERPLERLRREVALRRALAPVQEARKAGRFEEALRLLSGVRDDFRDFAGDLASLEAETALAMHMEAGKRAEADGDLPRAIASYEQARRLAPSRAGEAQARIAAIRAALEKDVADALAGQDLERQVEAYRRMNAVFGGQEHELEAKVLAFDIARLTTEGDQACAAKDFDRALGSYYKATEAARKLGRTDTVAEIEEKTRAARRLGQFQSYYNKGQAAEAGGKLDEALQAYRSAVTWVEKTDSGRAMLVQQRIEATEKRRQKEGVDSEAGRLFAEAVQALQQSRTDAAVAAFEALRQLKPDDERAQRALAFAREAVDMVYVPAAEARIGSRAGAPGAEKDEAPERSIALPAYFIDRNETRNRSYMAFVEGAQERRPEHWTLDRGAGRPKGFPPEQADHPVVYVSWEEAARFAAWAKKRLPSEEEWERAARGTDGRSYPWGDAPEGAKANISASQSDRVAIKTRPAGTSIGDTSPVGAVDMGGNVSEWTASAYAPYPGSEADPAKFDAEKRVIRGGSWRYGIGYARCANRDKSAPGERYAETGFRCVKDVPEWFTELK